LLLAAGTSAALPVVHHTLTVMLDPGGKHLQVEDKMRFPLEWDSRELASLQFSLHEGLAPRLVGSGDQLEAEGSPSEDSPWIRSYHLSLPPGQREITLTYGGIISHPLEEGGEEYARSFRETPGTIGTKGAYLAGATGWYPDFEDTLVSFSLEVELPEGWDVVSQGKRSLHRVDHGQRRVRWEETNPQDEIYLVAAVFHEFHRAAGTLEIQAFLRSPDQALAHRYLDVTARYVEMYRKLIGPYPYGKFALVENFWETGYGMPSFTLLGPSVIRLPFILHSSYPHEILHNWWGNGVYVDPKRGNWCEGLTAYLADHLIQEQRGRGRSYRLSSLQGYANYAAEKRDFPLAEFRERHSSATQAVGYGKCLMLFHMLRRKLGDELFTQALQRFYRKNRFHRASFDDVEVAFQSVTSEDLKGYFSQWVDRPGAPELQIAHTQVKASDYGYDLKIDLRQIQSGSAFTLDVPLVVRLEGAVESFRTEVRMTGKNASLELRFPARPLLLRLDPELDVFRKLHRLEIPPALSGAFGAERVTMVLPAAASPEFLEAYRVLAKTWKKSGAGALEVVLDKNLKALPRSHSVWLVGWENRFLTKLGESLKDQGLRLDSQGLSLGEVVGQKSKHSAVLAARHPGDPSQTLAWVAASEVGAVPGLARKLPHYGKYGYLLFEGAKPDNVAKGQWKVMGAPTVKVLDPGAAAAKLAKLPGREALASLPAVFDAGRIGQVVETLAGPDFQGRGLGSSGLSKAADWLTEKLQKTGWKVTFQDWTEVGGPDGKPVLHRNLVVVIPGSRKDWSGQSVVLGAHYDHLGFGWPEARQGAEGKLHPGADDNASGVAVLMELARTWRDWEPQRSVVLVFFTGEEAGMRGSRHYLKEAENYPTEKCLGMVNLDTVGRVSTGKLRALGTNTASEWPHVFRGVSWVTGIAVQIVPQDPGASDQVSFQQAGIPAIQLFTGPHGDYHRPGDSADKVDIDGLVQVATVVKEVVEYLAGREEALHSGLGRGHPASHSKPKKGRRVFLGTVPDYAQVGSGVKLESVLKDSPAEAAGVRAGDVIVGVGEQVVRGLREYADVLATLKPEQEILLHILRGKEKLDLPVRVVAR
jgi:hypothetical protein